ncbi:MAG TPA: sigma 54-interacting transcriptional regulator [Candidatus Sulfotelmatobacter sp.]|nr:sigma 54-interacting transcriptional regulator [Candidatus Sulfotelmatobacter sp.]
MPIELPTQSRAGTLTDVSVVWGEATAVLSLNRMVMELAGTHIPVLLAGESGTGKEVYARAIHRLAGGEASSFRKVSCMGLDPAHLQREIQKARTFESESGKTCTLFLDEIDALSQECQRLFLPYLSEAEPGNESGLEARLVSSTTCDLEREVEAGRFRRELYFRLNGACLRLPPLRERLEDLPALMLHFLNRQAEELKRKSPELNRETMEVLLSYHWPGNIRELENVAKKMVALGETNLAIADLRVARVNPPQGATSSERLSSLKVAAKAASRQTERELILQALERTKWNRKRAARELQISYKSLLYKLKQIETLGTKRDK